MLFEDLHSSEDSENDSDYDPDKELCSSEEEESFETKSEKRMLKEPGSPTKHDGKLRDETETGNKEISTDKNKKEKEDDLFKSFLMECEVEMKAKEAESGLFASSFSSAMSPELLEKNITDSSACDSPSVESTVEGTKKSVELFEFAGETVVVSQKIGMDGSVSVLSEANSDSEIGSKKPSANKRGLESVLGVLDHKKKKLSTLDKSKLDWLTFKKNEGIEEDLKKHNKGRGGFIERKRFLERSDLRAFEIERGMRHSKKKK